MIHKVCLLLLACFIYSTVSIEADGVDLRHNREAKATAFDAVTAMFLRPDAKTLGTLIDKDAQWKNYKPGSALEAIEEIENEPDDIALVSIQEIRFFLMDDIPELRERFPKARLWNADRVPKRLTNGLGCLIAWQNMNEQRPRDVELNVLVIKKLKDKYRIVYLDDLP